ncbi:hypothetical protein H0H87_001764 [Tephrocybe sp. NHM501043]|nr:hypothetical protein H0H87_001764 [Tephrocybe sp. NHM501043]
MEYTSINTCRHSSPHIWWLTFGILCLMYLMVLEVVVLGFVVFVVAPILFLFWNIVLICMGRHPLQTHNTIKPDIGKLPKAIVESIPLVLYIPPPPDTITHQNASVHNLSSFPSKPASPEPKQRFKFIRRLTSTRSLKTEKSLNLTTTKGVEQTGEPQTWEEHWEQGEYPFVILEENRAACAICLLDFAEPKRIWGQSAPAESEDIISEPGSGCALVPSLDVSKSASQTVTNTIADAPRNTERDKTLKLEDAGEGSQPLRLLACGHVFHKSCLDPWLLDISGRCPVCQRVVEIPDGKRPRKGRRPNGTR